jgi:Putative general bacterial porin
MSSPSSLPRRLIGAAVAAACAAFAVQAEEFSWQLSGAKRQVEAANFDSDSWAVDATFYMKPIEDTAGPYALASFLNPTTRVSATASRNDSPQDVFDDPTAYTLSGAYVLPGEKWYVGADYAKADGDDAPPVTISDPKGYGVHAGRYLGANTTLELRLGRSEQKSSLSCPIGLFCIGAPLEIELTTDSVGLEVLHVRRFRSLTYSLQGSVSERDTDFDIRPTNLLGIPVLTGGGQPVRQYSVAAELFPTDRLGVRVGYTRPDRDFNVDGYDLAATWFFKPRIAVQFTLSHTSVDDAPPGLGRSESAGVRFIGRL